MLRKFMPYWLFAGYIVIALVVKEAHPFSRFPMYSGFPAHVNFYYLADQNNKPIAGMAEFKFSVTQLKKVTSAHIHSRQITNESAGNLRAVGDDVLKYIMERNAHNPNLEKYAAIKLVKRDVALIHGTVSQSDTILSECRLSKTY